MMARTQAEINMNADIDEMESTIALIAGVKTHIEMMGRSFTKLIAETPLPIKLRADLLNLWDDFQSQAITDELDTEVRILRGKIEDASPTEAANDAADRADYHARSL